MAVIYIIIYSLYGHIKTLAEEIKKGIEASGTGSTATIYQVPETLPAEVITKMHGVKFDLPIIDASELKNADGFLFGLPTRFGNVPAQIKAFFDSTGGEWVSGALKEKFAGTFFSTGSQHGGQETTAFTSITWFVHQGITYVPLGYTPELQDNTELVGGGPWEKNVARTQGDRFAKIVSAYVKGNSFFKATAAYATTSTTNDNTRTQPTENTTNTNTNTATNNNTSNSASNIVAKCLVLLWKF
ncbi:1929_t:CDS:2 [Ambispora gerdemannii]|uniref:1929_t:CDS:1 n=1 Tax=Ambispora gerdemannii TaxID=144530 RepID=A0A9N8ZME4_9GLOM|nr:1929_t:CDS:2 [Ambispora gerdemannii]